MPTTKLKSNMVIKWDCPYSISSSRCKRKTFRQTTDTLCISFNSQLNNKIPSMRLSSRNSKFNRYRKIKLWLAIRRTNNNSPLCSPSSKISNRFHPSKARRPISLHKLPITWASFRFFRLFKRTRTNLGHKPQTRTTCNLNNLTSKIKAPIQTNRTCLTSKSPRMCLNSSQPQTTSTSSWSGGTLLQSTNPQS